MADQDAITAEEISGTSIPGANKKRNAFSELMSPKTKKPASIPEKVHRGRLMPFAGRDGLGAYTQDPATFPSSRVIYHNERFVAIHDLYPKSSVHTLLLPRSPKNLLHPFDALEDPVFLAEVRAETQKLRTLVAKELQRLYGRFSQQDQARERVLSGEDEAEALPAGRDWEKEVMAGIHAHPSMTHLHVHVMSVDRYSPSLKHQKHYNSFATPFFIDIADFPLAADDPRRHPGREGYLKAEFKCWRCGELFGNKFTKLKLHLAQEFQDWQRG